MFMRIWKREKRKRKHNNPYKSKKHYFFMKTSSEGIEGDFIDGVDECSEGRVVSELLESKDYFIILISNGVPIIFPKSFEDNKFINYLKRLNKGDVIYTDYGLPPRIIF